MPNDMLASNIRIDYNELRHLIHIDKSFGENASVVREVLDKGYTIGMIADSFLKYAQRDAPASAIEHLLEEARTQLKQYSSNGWIHHDKGTTELKCLALIFHGWKLAKVEEME